MIWSIFNSYWKWVFVSIDKIVGFEMVPGSGIGLYETWITGAIYWNVWLALIIFVAFLSILVYRLKLNADRRGDFRTLEKRFEDAVEAFKTTSILGIAASFCWPVIMWTGLVLLYPLPVLLVFGSIWLFAVGTLKVGDGAQYLYGLKKERMSIRKKQDEVLLLKRLNDPTYQKSLNELETWLTQERTTDYADKDRQAVGA